MVTSVGLQESEGDNLVEVVMVEFAMSINRQLEKKPRRTRRHVLGFSEEGALPQLRGVERPGGGMAGKWRGSLARVLHRCGGRGSPLGDGARDQQTAILDQVKEMEEAMDRRFQALEGKVHRLQDPPLQATAKADNRCQGLRSPDTPPTSQKREARDGMEELLGGMREQVDVLETNWAERAKYLLG